MITVYGITNCSTVKKARTWLEFKGIEYTFWDFKKQGVTTEQLQAWCDEFGWENVLNRKGMMWRKTDDKIKSKVIDTASAIDFMAQVPTAIKRPVIAHPNGYLIGFNEIQYTTTLLVL